MITILREVMITNQSQIETATPKKKGRPVKPESEGLRNGIKVDKLRYMRLRKQWSTAGNKHYAKIKANKQLQKQIKIMEEQRINIK